MMRDELKKIYSRISEWEREGRIDAKKANILRKIYKEKYVLLQKYYGMTNKTQKGRYEHLGKNILYNNEFRLYKAIETLLKYKPMLEKKPDYVESIYPEKEPWLPNIDILDDTRFGKGNFSYNIHVEQTSKQNDFGMILEENN